MNNLCKTATCTPKDTSLEKRIAVIESNYKTLESAIAKLEKANQNNLRERDNAYALLEELLVKGVIRYET